MINTIDLVLPLLLTLAFDQRAKSGQGTDNPAPSIQKRVADDQLHREEQRGRNASF
jgi:hypothetical protein